MSFFLHKQVYMYICFIYTSVLFNVVIQWQTASQGKHTRHSVLIWNVDTNTVMSALWCHTHCVADRFKIEYGAHSTNVNFVIRLLSGETISQVKNCTGYRRDSNPGSCRQNGHCCKRAKPLRHLDLLLARI